MIITIFDCLNANLQESKKPQTHHNCFMVNCGSLVRRAWVYDQALQTIFFLKKYCELVDQVSCPNALQFKRCIQKRILYFAC